MGKNSFLGITFVNLALAIVIISALVFVVFHKLFAIDAQVRALEVNPQAGMWNKLQVTYALEFEKLGTFKEIGYVPYGKVSPDGESSKSSVFSYTSDLIHGTGRFLAVNRITLKECRKYEGHWMAYGNPEQFVGNAVVELPIARCAILTPHFELLRAF